MAKNDDYKSRIHETDELYDALLDGRGTFSANEVRQRYKVLVNTSTRAVENSTVSSFDELIDLIDKVKEEIEKFEELFNEHFPDVLSGQSERSERICKNLREKAIRLYGSNGFDRVPHFDGKSLSRIFLQNLRMFCVDNSDKTKDTKNNAERVSQTTDNPTQKIPSEFMTRPMSKNELAGYYSVSVKVISSMTKLGSIRFNKINRQLFIFDMRDLSKVVRDKIDNLK